MALILDMASGTEHPGEKLDCPNQRTEKTQLLDAARDDDYPPLQLATIKATAPVKQPAGALPGFVISSLLKSIEL